ncbi:MAG TPA: hypothetical protein VMZ06_02935 [Candidatus Bathyarchaeia archaeon]|nr:hypothetical protein [Candidatus Bathyarchaeia archaeon]
MRTLILLVLVGLMAFLALDSAGIHLGWPASYQVWKVRLFGMHLPAEVFALGLILAVLLLFPRPEKKARVNSPEPRPPAADIETLREVNQMLERMERRIESLETILLDRDARVKRTAEHD